MSTINGLTRDCFNAIIRMRRMNSVPHLDAAAFHQEIRDQIDRMMGRAFASGFARDDVYAVTYAIVALADTLATRNKGPLGTYWRDHGLQEHYFAQSSADDADGFFERLTALRQAGKRDVLQVYATCLALGYRGRLRAADADSALASLQSLVQPSAWLDAGAGVVPQPRDVRAWQPYWLPLGALILCVALYVILSSSMHMEAAAFTGYLDTLLRSN